MVCPRAQAHHGQGPQRALFSLFCRHPRVDQRQLHIGECCHPRQQVEVLKDKTYLPIAHVSQFTGAHLAHRYAVEPVVAAGGTIQAAQDVHKRRFPRTRWPHNGYELATGYLQVNGAQRWHNSTPQIIVFAQFPHSNNRHCSCCPVRLLIILHILHPFRTLSATEPAAEGITTTATAAAPVRGSSSIAACLTHYYLITFTQPGKHLGELSIAQPRSDRHRNQLAVTQYHYDASRSCCGTRGTGGERGQSRTAQFSRLQSDAWEAECRSRNEQYPYALSRRNVHRGSHAGVEVGTVQALLVYCKLHRVINDIRSGLSDSFNSGYAGSKRLRGISGHRELCGLAYQQAADIGFIHLGSYTNLAHVKQDYKCLRRRAARTGSYSFTDRAINGRHGRSHRSSEGCILGGIGEIILRTLELSESIIQTVLCRDDLILR